MFGTQHITTNVGSIAVSIRVTRNRLGHKFYYAWFYDSPSTYMPFKYVEGGHIANIIGEALLIHGIRTIGHA